VTTGVGRLSGPSSRVELSRRQRGHEPPQAHRKRGRVSAAGKAGTAATGALGRALPGSRIVAGVEKALIARLPS